MKKPFRFGPALLVTAAFIGPGTVFTASSAGAEFGFALLWAIAFAILAAVVLQEMAARLGIVTGDGLSRAHAFRARPRQNAARDGDSLSSGEHHLHVFARAHLG